MNIFRIFFVSTVLIPVLVVVATSNESGIRVRKPRNIVISEDGTRTGRRLKPVNISDRNCPALGCTGNLTSDTFNGKGSLASTLLPNQDEIIDSSKPRRFDNENFPHQHNNHPLKLEIRSIKNSTRSDYEVALDDDLSLGRSIFNYAIAFSWSVYWVYKVVIGLVVVVVVRYCWNLFRKSFGVPDDYIEYFVKIGNDAKHPFGGWNKLPTFGISLKSKVEEHKEGWGWPEPSHHHHSGAYASSHHHSPHDYWPPMHYGGSEYYGWPSGWKSESKEEEGNLRHKFDQKKGWKYAQKYTKKYAKKAHKYGLRPSKYSYLYDKDGNIQLDNKGINFAWRRRK